MNEKTQTSHIEYTAPRGTLYENTFCIICGLIGIGMFIIGWLYVTLFPIS
ncbi:MAG: hypothetical protein PVJ05_14770 [Candidatus Thorarchaeota archaeon]|jgi:hypothetical protein